MAKLYYENDADLGLLDGSTIAVIGYGSQGHAHALNLRDSGVSVIVGLRPGGASWATAEADGFHVYPVAEATRRANVVMVLAPDTSQKAIYEEHIEPYLNPGDSLMFAHGFNVRYGQIEAPKGVDVSMVAPKSPGHRVRELYVDNEGPPALVAVAQDASGSALPRALAYAKGIGCTRAGVLETSFTEETETDLFGEQAVLCGGVSALVRAGFETLVEAGYQPEVAYFECLHELKLIVDLMYRGGLGHMWYSVSDTAEHGGYEGGSRLVDDSVRERMRGILADVQDGSYARRWIEEDQRGRPHFNSRRAEEGRHSIEEVGQRLRSMMGFLEAESASSSTASEPVSVAA